MLSAPTLMAALAGSPAAALPRSTGAILKSGVLSARDVPSTWIATPRTTAPNPFPGDAACRSLAAAERVARRSPHAASPQYSDPESGNTTQADNSVYAFPSPAGAHRYLAAYEAAEASACLRLVLSDAVGTSASVTLEPLTTQLAGLGDERAGYEGTVQGTNGAGQTVALVADIVAVRVGRAATVFEFLSANQQIAAGPAIVTTVVRRLGGP
ncbi:MAG TPA: hypothetical protein VGU73_00180 [Acidimicrobiia bacterium]|nr:hypothetical protein [Acidimicrobiia bacterium]